MITHLPLFKEFTIGTIDLPEQIAKRPLQDRRIITFFFFFFPEKLLFRPAFVIPPTVK